MIMFILGYILGVITGAFVYSVVKGMMKPTEPGPYDYWDEWDDVYK